MGVSNFHQNITGNSWHVYICVSRSARYPECSKRLVIQMFLKIWSHQMFSGMSDKIRERSTIDREKSIRKWAPVIPHPQSCLEDFVGLLLKFKCAHMCSVYSMLCELVSVRGLSIPPLVHKNTRPPYTTTSYTPWLQDWGQSSNETGTDRHPHPDDIYPDIYMCWEYQKF